MRYRLTTHIVLPYFFLDRDRAFAASTSNQSRDTVNRKATIVIEHLIQASDVGHTMQHWVRYFDMCAHQTFFWRGFCFVEEKPVEFCTRSYLFRSSFFWQHIYRKWNEHLFEEMYMAYLNGRSDRNPADFWFKVRDLCLIHFTFDRLLRRIDTSTVFRKGGFLTAFLLL